MISDNLRACFTARGWEVVDPTVARAPGERRYRIAIADPNRSPKRLQVVASDGTIRGLKAVFTDEQPIRFMDTIRPAGTVAEVAPEEADETMWIADFLWTFLTHLEQDPAELVRVEVAA